MTETVLEKEICAKCGAEIRPGAKFCYSCGGAVVEENELNGNSPTVAGSRETEANVSVKPDSDVFENSGAIEKPVGLPLDAAAPVQRKPGIRDKKLVVQKETNLKTAASLRQKAKPETAKTKEVLWETPENSNHLWFVVVSLILFVFAVLVLMTMLYLD